MTHEHEHVHGPDCDHDHADEEEAVDISGWLRDQQPQTCPACGATGAIQLGGGIFCPTCKEVSTNPGYTPPA